MTPAELQADLANFASAQKFKTQGPLSIALVVTNRARSMGFPLDPERMLASSGGQVQGAGGSAAQNILKRHGITRVLSKEGGRTSRGSIAKMRDYAAFLNDLASQGPVDLDVVEKFWIDRVHEFFAGKPFRIRLDASRSLRTVVRDVLAQAEERQKTSGGVHYSGAVMQHLVGAKLDCALGQGQFQHNSFSTADAPSGRAGDFLIGDVAIHVTTSPGEAVIERCRENIDAGHRPILVTGQRGLTAAEVLAENGGLADRIDAFEIEQFIALNLYELGKFAADGRRVAVNELVERYNEIVDDVETDPSLKIEFR
jgi:hypothetical protein